MREWKTEALVAVGRILPSPLDRPRRQCREEEHDPSFLDALEMTINRNSDRHHHLTDRPQREPGELEMRPRERDANDRDGEEKRGDDMSEREPPTGEDQPDEIADHAERAGAYIIAADDGGA